MLPTATPICLSYGSKMNDLNDSKETSFIINHNRLGFIRNEHGSIHLKVCWIVLMNTMPLRNIWCVLFLLIWLQCATGMDLLFSCDFGIVSNGRFCGMVQGVEDDFDWKLTAASGKSGAGPSQDHTGNPGGAGRFLWADSAGGAPGQKATIATPLFNLTGDEGWLTFWYNLHADGIVNIGVCQGEDPVLTFKGNQRDEWHEQDITVSCGDKPVQITFTSTLNSMTSDVGVDDLYLYHDIMTTTDRVTTAMTDTPVTTNVPATSPGLATTSSVTTIAGFTKGTDETHQSSTSLSSPLPIKGSSPALPISLSVVAVFFVAALIMVICFIRKRRKKPEKPIAMESVQKYDNHAYSSNMNDVLDDTTDTRRNTNSTFDSSTWRSAASTMNGTGVNDTLGGSQPPNRSSQASSASGSGVQGGDPESRHYFVLNPGRASMLVENGEEEARNPYDPVALYDNKPERYTYIENDGSSIAMATGDAGGVGMEDNGYDPVTIKDDTTGGYQYVDDTGAPVANGGTNHGDLPSPYESVAIGEASSKSNKSNAGERKIPIPAARKNIAPKPKERMVDNVLYKPLNGEKMVDNVLYNPI